MTSTSFQIGLAEARNSSRVLRPPGGGHTDIFGVHEDPPQPPKKTDVSLNNGDSVKGIYSDPPKENSCPIKNNDTIEVITAKCEIPDLKPEVISQPEVVITPQPIVEPPQRKRIPPGGFSSGLW